jgi:hypothetical protein
MKPTATPTPTPTPTPTATPTAGPPGVLNVNPTSVAVAGLGSTYALQFVAGETGYTGAFTESDTCSGVATVTTPSAKGPSATYTVTGVAAGTCTATIKDSFGQSAAEAISVTTGTIVIQRRGRH